MSLSNLSTAPTTNPIIQHVDFLAAESISHGTAALLTGVMTVPTAVIFGALTHVVSEGVYQVAVLTVPSIPSDRYLSTIVMCTSHIIGMIAAFFTMIAAGCLLDITNVIIITLTAIAAGSIIGTIRGSVFGTVSPIITERITNLATRA